MARTGVKRYVDFRVEDVAGNPVTGLVLGDFTVIFTRDTISCTDALELAEPGNGRYIISYTPSAAGHDYIDIYNVASDLRLVDIEQIDSVETFFGPANVVAINHDYPIPGSLQVKTVSDPQEFLLYVFNSSDWQAGRRTPQYSVSQTALGADGKWVDTLTLAKGTYHLVIQDGIDRTQVISAYLVL